MSHVQSKQKVKAVQLHPVLLSCHMGYIARERAVLENKV